ncbi:hypothetical protein PRIPAC_93932 [Pristionchus pacificus]|uniref:Uncharacterized protein n=1 Tax=Pristionchus pacificus TaxID=54126 RepID=A0A2A6BR23_PRIPA|nr:hypothetical protein PRIPAC_93932 [Pristionchus pacificus]|eukprot:PDM68345.1 hypothetical protein PRIPAC_46389 [Pristionchus pacificus]
MIFDLLPYSIGEIKLVSRSWRSMADDWIYSNNAEFFKVEVSEATEENAIISFKFSNEKATCFPQLRGLFKDSTLEATREITLEDGLRSVTFVIPYDRLDIYRFFPMMKFKVRLAMINVHDVKRYPGKNLFQTAFDLFMNLKKSSAFFCFVNNLDNYCVDFVYQLTAAVKITYFHSNSQISTVSDPRRFLLEIAGRLKVISITQRGIFTKSENEFLFLGTKDVNWVETFLEMFDRGLRELRVDNSRTAYITAAEAAFIAETLAVRGKPFIFQTTLHDTPIQPKGCDWGRKLLIYDSK